MTTTVISFANSSREGQKIHLALREREAKDFVDRTVGLWFPGLGVSAVGIDHSGWVLLYYYQPYLTRAWFELLPEERRGEIDIRRKRRGEGRKRSTRAGPMFFPGKRTYTRICMYVIQRRRFKCSEKKCISSNTERRGDGMGGGFSYGYFLAACYATTAVQLCTRVNGANPKKVDIYHKAIRLSNSSLKKKFKDKKSGMSKMHD